MRARAASSLHPRLPLAAAIVALVFGVLLVPARVARAADALALSLDEALVRAQQAPRAQALEAIAALQDEAGARWVWPGLSIEALPGARLSPRGVANPSAQGVLQVPVVLGDVKGAREALLRASADEARAERAALERALTRAVVDAWFARRAAELRVTRAAEALAAAREERDAVARAQALDAKNALDVAELDAFVAELDLERLDAEGERTDRGLRLGRLVGEAGEVATDARALEDVSADAPPTPPSAEAPEVLYLRAAAESAQADRAYRALGTAPILGVGLAAQVDDPETGFAFARLSLTLPALGGDPVTHAALSAQHERARAGAEDAARDAATLHATLAHEQRHAREILDVLTHQLVPASRARLALLTTQHALGDAALFELLRARRALLAATLRQERAALDVQRVDALARLAPSSLSQSSNQEPTP